MASSSSLACIGNQRLKYDVFVSFRGEDIRYTFLTHLAAALRRKGILVFIDDKLEKGEEIPALFTAIEESKLFIIIFSENFASSTWCLKEVAKIIGCRKTKGQMVVPIFYHVDPADVRKQRGRFAKAFAKHDRDHTMEEVEKWRLSLTKAANLSGWSLVSKTRSEFKLVEDIVRDVSKKLNRIPLSNSEGLVGIHSHVEKMESLLCLGLDDDVRTVGIWGMGGIGKTTVAEVIFNQIADQFEGCCFLENVREESQKYGLPYLQQKLLSKIFEGEEFSTKASPNIGRRSVIKDRLQRYKVLIVLDDVDNTDQLESLVGGSDCFGPGSRIILTSRNRHVFERRVDKIYEVEELNYPDALQLFSRYAFRQHHPTEEYKELSSKVVDYAKGNPLALKVLGSSLIGKSKLDWESALNKLERIPPDGILEKLRISFDGLERTEKRIFLDIACLFKEERENKHYVTKILDGCGFYSQIGIRVLIDKSLVTIKGEKLCMHDLLQEMGRSIVFEESEEPGKRSRLWVPKDAYDVLTKNKGTKVVEGIILDLCGRNDVHFRSDTFAKMVRLRVLKIYDSNSMYGDFGHVSKMLCKAHLPKEGLEYLPDELRCLCWHGYPLKSLPSNFDLENLVYLDLRYSHIERLWKGLKHLPKLIFIDLRYSTHLTKTSDFSDVPNIEHINLQGCTGLRKVDPSIGALSNLKLLSLSGCKEVRSFPMSIHLPSLETLNLSGCSNLKKFPEISGKMERLWHLVLKGTAIDELPSSIENLAGLRFLVLTKCKRLNSLPSSIGQLKSLGFLNLSGCSKLESLPVSICNLTSLGHLDLSGCSKLENFPVSIKTLNRLSVLILDNCERLQSLPDPSPSIKKLHATNCTSLKSVSFSASLRPLLFPNDLDFNLSPSFFPNDLDSNLSPSFFPTYLDFNFSNCIELDQHQQNNIVEAAMQGIQWMAIPVFQLIQELCFGSVPESEDTVLVFPIHTVFLSGSEIPEWFHNHRMGEWINIQMPTNWLNSRFMGFVVCAVFESKYVFQNPDYSLYLACTFKTEGYQQTSNIKFHSGANNRGDRLLKTDHVFLGYAQVVMHEKWPSKFIPSKFFPIEVSFKFYTSNDEKGRLKDEKGWVKKCGVHLICTKDDKFVVSDEDFDQSMRKVTNRKRDHDDCCCDEAKPCEWGSCEGEPPRKRNK